MSKDIEKLKADLLEERFLVASIIDEIHCAARGASIASNTAITGPQAILLCREMGVRLDDLRRERDEARAEIERLKAEIARMRPVVEAASKVRRSPGRSQQERDAILDLTMAFIDFDEASGR